MSDELNTTQPTTTQPKSEVQTPSKENTPINPFAEFKDKDVSTEENKQSAVEVKEQIQEYKIKFPDTIPSEIADIHINTFKTAGVEPDKAQKVIDALAQHDEQAHNQRIDDLHKSLKADERVLKQELGSNFEPRLRNIARFFHKENIPDSDVQTLVSEWGFQKTFKFFDRFVQMSKEPSLGDTVARGEGSGSAVKDDVFDDQGFKEQWRAGDPKAGAKIRSWAEQNAKTTNII
ncbi:hypothetical protein [Candidatus Liberibacter brunswickensis]|uniref:hypothetical protein n=1 Tax=Candidatus Liberibacter brunswickensis TaxID=1968796 RepID=UPI002FE1F51A